MNSEELEKMVDEECRFVMRIQYRAWESLLCNLLEYLDDRKENGMSPERRLKLLLSFIEDTIADCQQGIVDNSEVNND